MPLVFSAVFSDSLNSAIQKLLTENVVLALLAQTGNGKFAPR